MILLNSELNECLGDKALNFKWKSFDYEWSRSKICALIQEKKLLYEAEVESYWKKRNEKRKRSFY
jgi:hypothetical protein